MKGYIPVNVPVKRYVKAYMQHHLGFPIKLDRKLKDPILEKLFDYLEKDAPPIGNHILRDYPTSINIWLTYDQFDRYGAKVRGANLRQLNGFAESLIKDKMRFLLNESWRMTPGLDCHLPAVRDSLGITIEDWSDDSMKKDYYRYRVRNGMEILKQAQYSVGCVEAVHLPFL